MESFRKLGLSEPLLQLLKEAGFSKPSEIQERTIPLVMEGKDVIGGSATGSGKTLAFGAGIIERTEIDKGLQVLILTPTRELAEQVGNVFKQFSSYKDLNTAIVYGGVNIGHQIKDLQNSEIVVGTPGRILDHLERGTINLSHIKILVLDEADRMLDMGFINDVEKIVKNCPKERQTLLFSATISNDIVYIANKYMKSPVEVAVESYVDPTKLKQVYYDVPRHLKFSLLVHLLKHEKQGLVMVFCNTRHNTEFLEKNLRRMSIDVVGIHGGLTQQKRNKIMEKFHHNQVAVLVCTDVAARGLDIKGISHVYNYDIPKNSKDYIHRIGRTARAGKEGIAVNILSDRDYENFSNVLRDDSIHIEKEELPQVETVRLMVSNPQTERRTRWDSDNWRGRREGQRQGGGHGRNFGVRHDGRRDFGRDGGRDGDREGRRPQGRFGNRNGSFRGRDGSHRSKSRGRSFGGNRGRRY